MAATATAPQSTAAVLDQYQRDGYVIVRGLIPPAEIAQLTEHFMTLRDTAPRDKYSYVPAAEAKGDPLQVYPRMMHPHRFDETAKRYLLDPRILAVLRAILGEEPVAAQSMFYFKPAGARGQALHQDNFYLLVRPGTCLAAWVACDYCDEENGGLTVVPKTNHLQVECPTEADTTVSFTSQLVEPPPGTHPIPANMAPGDVLFFNGNVIHGSTPNRSQDRFRRSFICHYLAASDQEISHWYFPLLDSHGQEVAKTAAVGGGPCGKEVVV